MWLRGISNRNWCFAVSLLTVVRSVQHLTNLTSNTYTHSFVVLLSVIICQ